jgi:hypothetical protein
MKQSFITALAGESRIITDALAAVGYKTIKIDLNQINNSINGIFPEMRIWVQREIEDEENQRST